MREKALEVKLRDAVRAIGGQAFKLVCPGTAGVPDRMLLMPEGRVAFVEVKAPGCRPGKLQAARIRQLRALGFYVFVLDSAEQIAGIIETFK